MHYDDATGKLHVGKNTQTGAIPHDGLQYRRGTPETDGTITWDAVFQTVIATGNNVGDFCLVTDTDGKAWFGYGDNYADSATKGNAKCIKNSATDGTWSTAAGFPATIRAGVSEDAFAVLAPLAAGAMHATTYEWNTNAVANGYTVATDGTVTSEGAITDQAIESDGVGAAVGRIETAARDGVVHMAYTKAGGDEIRYRRRSAAGSWGTETLLASGKSDIVISSPRISFDGAAGAIIMWSTHDVQYVCRSTDDGLTFGAAATMNTQVTLEETYEHLMPAEYTDDNGALALTYLNANYGLVWALLPAA